MRKSVREDRIKEIHDAALKVFSDKGFDKATLDEIAEIVDITKPALYIYFKSKEAIFSSMIRIKLEIIRKEFDLIIDKKNSPVDKLEDIIKMNFSFYQKNMEFFRVMHNLRSSTLGDKERSKFKKDIFSRYKNYVEKIANIIKECMKDRYLKNDDEYFLTFSLIGIINQNIFREILNRDEFSENKVNLISDKIINLFLSGAGK